MTSACVGIPEDGPVVESESQVQAGEELGFYNDPPGPGRGEPPTDIVRHFLDAHAAIPLQTNTAEEFLTSEEAATWRPQRRIITYDAASFPQGSNQVTVELDGARLLDSRGSWRGALAADQTELSFRMTRVDGEWRISDAPDALVVPSTWFDRAFRRVSLYFMDPTARILVPEPVYVPRGDSLASALVEGLLAGPVVQAPGVERSFLPAGLEVDLSVTVTESGIAEVPLIGQVSMPTEEDATLLVAQLARTLAQDSTLSGFRVTINDEPVTLPDGPGGTTTFGMDQGESLDPAGSRATSLLFGLRDGRLVSGPADSLEVASGPLGQSEVGVRSVGVNLDGSRVAGVLTEGDAVQVTDVRSEDADVVPVSSGAGDLAPPVWDDAERLWLLDRAPGGALVSAVADGQPREVAVPGVSGRRVSHFLVSRDGSRLVAVIDRRGRDQVVVSRLQYDVRGRALGGTRAREIAWDDQPGLSVVDIGWSSPTSIVVAHRLGGDLFQVRTLPVDGAPAGITGVAVTLRQRPRMLVTSPRVTDPLYVLTSSGLSELVGGVRTGEIDDRTTFLTYAGG